MEEHHYIGFKYKTADGVLVLAIIGNGCGTPGFADDFVDAVIKIVCYNKSNQIVSRQDFMIMKDEDYKLFLEFKDNKTIISHRKIFNESVKEVYTISKEGTLSYEVIRKEK